ncbi:hypothetical protein F7725_004900 [Dissostichus mawsoni]|uniref:Uncharacterized protein n=1 Tax=Dissostichus mawsoni TaxID=36200 RepID=A0A7J5XK24_DISMA|nr:hypothetical protein F7725_004900 [Dissostichus mawsoni]
MLWTLGCFRVFGCPPTTMRLKRWRKLGERRSTAGVRRFPKTLLHPWKPSRSSPDSLRVWLFRSPLPRGGASDVLQHLWMFDGGTHLHVCVRGGDGVHQHPRHQGNPHAAERGHRGGAPHLRHGPGGQAADGSSDGEDGLPGGAGRRRAPPLAEEDGGGEGAGLEGRGVYGKRPAGRQLSESRGDECGSWRRSKCRHKRLKVHLPQNGGGGRSAGVRRTHPAAEREGKVSQRAAPHRPHQLLNITER